MNIVIKLIFTVLCFIMFCISFFIFDDIKDMIFWGILTLVNQINVSTDIINDDKK